MKGNALFYWSVISYYFLKVYWKEPFSLMLIREIWRQSSETVILMSLISCVEFIIDFQRNFHKEIASQFGAKEPDRPAHCA